MRGSVFRQCWCRDPETGKKLHAKCPKLKQKNHGSWWVRFDAPRAPGERRRQPLAGPFRTQREAEEELAASLARIGGGGSAPDRSIRLGAYLTAYAEGKIDVKPRTQDAIREAVNLYWCPALGHMRLVDVRDHHIAEAVREMMKINNLAAAEKPSEMMRRLMAARAGSPRKGLPADSDRKKSLKPLSPARIKRVFAVLHAAMQAAVPGRISVNPCDGVILPRIPRVRPLPWTGGREDAFRAALSKRESAMLAGRDRSLTAAEKQRLWASPTLRPSPVMVWMPDQTGTFLDYVEQAGDRLFALFCLAAYCGPRRDEITGLAWPDVDLDQAVASIRETGVGGGPKSDAGIRVIPLPEEEVVKPLRSWRAVQLAEKFAWGADWTDTGRVFTREDGTAVPGQWVSVRFETLAYRAGLPPVRFHDLRHGTASLCKAAGLDTKFISALLGHSRSSFTDDVYIHLFPEVAKAAAKSAAAVVPRRFTAS